jgi:hypothetical protein
MQRETFCYFKPKNKIFNIVFHRYFTVFVKLVNAGKKHNPFFVIIINFYGNFLSMFLKIK